MKEKHPSLPRTKSRYFRILLRLMMWPALWLVVRHYSIPALTKDNLQVIQHASIVVFVQSIVVYYCLDLFIFPRFLYKRNLGLLLLFVTILYQLIHITNYFEFSYLVTISDVKLDDKDLYVYKIWNNYLKSSTWTSCFSNFPIAYFNYAWSLFYVTPILAVKVMSDIVILRTKNLRLERDQLLLEKNNLFLKSQGLKLQHDNLQLEINFLRSQINPHFLFNILNAIYTRTVDADEIASDIVLKLSNLMRYGLYESNGSKVSLTKEIDYIRNYLDLEKYRFSENILITFHVAGNCNQHQIAPLLLISFVENAFKHGTYSDPKSSFVSIAIHIKKSSLYFSVKNSLSATCGIKENNTPEKMGGFGLLNTRRRLELIYPNCHSLEIIKNSDSFEVILWVDLSQKQE